MLDSIKRGAAFAGAVTVLAVPTALTSGVAHAAPTPVDGLFGVTAGSCGGGSATGSYFRMILPAGNTSGPFLANGDSTCSDKTITPLSPGTGGGLRSGSYQPQPQNSWDAGGNATTGSVTAPLRFYGVGFATATSQVDPQTGQQTATPRIFNDGGTLSGDLSAFGAFWNKQVFNQGAPKPGGAYSGKTSPVRGTYNAQTGDYVLEWTSQIVGGPFNNFTGLWHLTGKVAGAPGAAAPAAGRAPGTNPAAAPGKTPGQPAAGAPAVAAQQPQVSNNITVRPVAQSSALSSPWLTGGVVALVAVASAVLTNADRLFRRRRS